MNVRRVQQVMLAASSLCAAICLIFVVLAAHSHSKVSYYLGDEDYYQSSVAYAPYDDTPCSQVPVACDDISNYYNDQRKADSARSTQHAQTVTAVVFGALAAAMIGTAYAVRRYRRCPACIRLMRSAATTCPHCRTIRASEASGDTDIAIPSV